MREKTYYVYILASKSRVMYVGVTGNLHRRLWEHKTKQNQGFTNQYNVNRLVYYEETNDINEALYREKQLKNWKHWWKVELIEKENPCWEDLSKDWID